MTEVDIRSPQAEFVDLGWAEAGLRTGRGAGALHLRLSLPDDRHSVVARADFAEQLAAEGGQFPAGLMWSVLQGGEGRWKVLGVAGLEPLGGRRWGVWSYMSDMTPRQWAFAARAAWFVMKWAWRRGSTLQAVPAPTSQAVRMLKRIGFVDVGEAYMVWEG